MIWEEILEGPREVYMYHSCGELATEPIWSWRWEDKGCVTMSVRKSGKTVLRRYERMVVARTRMVRESMVVIIGDDKGMIWDTGLWTQL